MVDFIPWISQPPNKWAENYAEGKFIDLVGRRTHYLEAGMWEPVILIHGFFSIHLLGTITSLYGGVMTTHDEKSELFNKLAIEFLS